MRFDMGFAIPHKKAVFMREDMPSVEQISWYLSNLPRDDAAAFEPPAAAPAVRQRTIGREFCSKFPGRLAIDPEVLVESLRVGRRMKDARYLENNISDSIKLAFPQNTSNCGEGWPMLASRRLASS